MLNREERQRILKKIGIMNPSLAEELRGSCASFTDLVHLDSAIIAQLFKVLKPEVIGLSLIGSSIELQKKVLSSAPRDLAEISYEIMSSPEANKKQDVIARAKSQVMSKLNQFLASN